MAGNSRSAAETAAAGKRIKLRQKPRAGAMKDRTERIMETDCTKSRAHEPCLFS